MEVPRTDRHVVRACVVLTLIIGKVLFARKVFDVEFSLFDRICNPKKSHFHGSRALPFNSVVRDADGRRVVAIYWYCGLQMAKFFECDAKNCGLFEVEKEGTTAQSVKNAPLSLIGFVASGFHPMKKWPHTRLCAFDSER